MKNFGVRVLASVQRNEDACNDFGRRLRSAVALPGNGRNRLFHASEMLGEAYRQECRVDLKRFEGVTKMTDSFVKRGKVSRSSTVRQPAAVVFARCFLYTQQCSKTSNRQS